MSGGDWATVVAAAIGALAGISGGTVLEMFKRRSDQRGAAFALSGAIRASVTEADLFRVVDRMADLQKFLDEHAEEPFVAAKLFQTPPNKPGLAVFDRHIDRLSLLEPRLSERVIVWFSAYAGFQHLLWVVVPNCETNRSAAAVIKHALSEWPKTMNDAEPLARDLHDSVRRSCW
jgi:hypothetical protein